MPAVRTAGGSIRIADPVWGPGRAIVHRGVVESGVVREGEDAYAQVDPDAREATARSHTATHIVHWTVRHLLGEHALQAGSLVVPGRLRFDFSHHQALPRDQLEQLEYEANRRLAEDSAVRAYETTMEYARSQGAIALFGEKYGDIVRVVEVGDYSRELCGGTHVPHTGKVALVRVLHEGSIGSGLRRIEALVGPDALRHVNAEHRLLEEVAAALGGGDPEQAPERARRAVERIKQLESELGKVRRGERREEVARLADAGIDVDGVKLVFETKAADPSELRDLALRVRDHLKGQAGAVVLLGPGANRTSVVAAVTPPLVALGVRAADIVQPVAVAAGGNAGGKPDIAMGGGPGTISPEEATVVVQQRLRELLTSG